MNWLFQAIHALSPNCKEAIRLQSSGLDRKLPWLQRVGLRLHVALCSWCWRYGQHMLFLREAAKKCDHDHETGATLPDAARERIKHALHAAK